MPQRSENSSRLYRCVTVSDGGDWYFGDKCWHLPPNPKSLVPINQGHRVHNAGQEQEEGFFDLVRHKFSPGFHGNHPSDDALNWPCEARWSRCSSPRNQVAKRPTNLRKQTAPGISPEAVSQPG